MIGSDRIKIIPDTIRLDSNTPSIPSSHLITNIIDSNNYEVTLNSYSIKDLSNIGGNGVHRPGERIRAYTPNGELLAILIFEPERLWWRPEKVLAGL